MVHASAVVTRIEEESEGSRLVYGVLKESGECVIGMEGAGLGYADMIEVYWSLPKSTPVKIGDVVSVEMELKPAFVWRQTISPGSHSMCPAAKRTAESATRD